AAPAPVAQPVATAAPAKGKSEQAGEKPRKLSYKEQRELDGMEAAVDEAESRKAALEAQLADPAVFSNASKVAALQGELEQASAEVDRLWTRWQELQELQAGG